MSRRYFTPIKFQVPDFSGGLNYRDNDLAENELAHISNFLINARGSLESRLGSMTSQLLGLGAPSQMAGLWKTLGRAYYQQDVKLYVSAVASLSGGGSPFSTGATLVHSFTTNDRIAICEFNGKLVGVHPVDGVFTVDAALTFAIVEPTIKCKAICSWQNYVLAAGDSVFPSRVWRSNIGNPAVWTTASDFNDLREVDDSPITCIGGGLGMDVQGRPTLFVAKHDSCYRINNPTTLAYTTLHRTAGALNPYAVTTVGPTIGFLHSTGLYLTDGINAPVKVSGKIDPIFDTGAGYLDFTTTDGWSCGRYGRRFVFAVNRAGVGLKLLFLYDPDVQWITRFDVGLNIGPMFNWTPQVVAAGDSVYFDTLFAADPVEARTMAWLFRFDRGQDRNQAGNDVNVAVAAYSKWFQPGGDGRVNLRHVRAMVRGPGNIGFSWLKDFDSTTIATITPSVGTSATKQRDKIDVWGLGRARAFQLRFSGSQNDVYTIAEAGSGDLPRIVGQYAVHNVEATAYSLGDA